eukprot:TRINITY_DN2880_c0_g2_i8.p1 TRINITY_DN2880_c0_g2~~TRINITY_DN2880_c0_g2_i8.p1  ORF type:complete len:468 (+),score=28.43 TRINITY_DN2880_c0_g2_i8:94-1404(+)
MSRLLSRDSKQAAKSTDKSSYSSNHSTFSDLIAARISLVGVKCIPESLIHSSTTKKQPLRSKQPSIAVVALFDGSSFSTKSTPIDLNNKQQVGGGSYINCEIKEQFYIVFNRSDISGNAQQPSKSVTLMVKLEPAGQVLGKVSIKLNTIKALQLENGPQDYQLGHAVMRLGLDIRLVENKELPIRQVELRTGQLENRKIIAHNPDQGRKKMVQKEEKDDEPSLAPLPQQSQVIGIFENQIQEVSMSKKVMSAVGAWRSRPRLSPFISSMVGGGSIQGENSIPSSSTMSNSVQKHHSPSTNQQHNPTSQTPPPSLKQIAPAESIKSLHGQQLKVKQLSVSSSIHSMVNKQPKQYVYWPPTHHHAQHQILEGVPDTQPDLSHYSSSSKDGYIKTAFEEVQHQSGLQLPSFSSQASSSQQQQQQNSFIIVFLMPFRGRE